MKIRLALILLAGGLWLTGCEKSDQLRPPVERKDADAKTFMLYGDIEPYYSGNVRAAGKAVASGALIGGQRVVVYQERSGGNVIFELVRDAAAAAGYREVILKTYAPGEVATMNPVHMRGILTEMRRLAPANHYGLALGMHGSGWIPKDIGLSGRSVSALDLELFEIPENPLTRYLGGNAPNRMDISGFVGAVEGMDWDFLLFDACFMASVEALYDMRGLAPYIIASPAEILIEGFPYDRVVNLLFSDWDDLAAVADAFVDYYCTGSYPSATVSLVRTSELEALADAAAGIYSGGVNAVDPIAAEMQVFEGLSAHLFFDLGEYMKLLSTNGDLYQDFADQLQRTVVFSDHTDYFITAYPVSMGGQWIPIDPSKYSGLTVFVPYDGNALYAAAQQSTGWYKAVNGVD